MRRTVALIGLIVLMGLLVEACAKPTYMRVDPRQSFSEAKTNNDRYPKKAAMVLAVPDATSFTQQAQDYFLQQVTATIREESGSLELLVPNENDMPAFLEAPGLLADGSGVFAICQKARSQDVQYLIRAQVLNIAAEERKTGIWWFRKTRYFMDVDVALDVYDTTTGAKLFSQAETNETKVDVTNYEAFRSGSPYEIPRVNDIIADMAEKLGEAAADAVQNSRWMAMVTKVEADQIAIGAGSSVGVSIGDRFVIFEGRRIVSGPDGGKYIVPGYKIAEVRVTAVEPQRVVAVLEGKGGIEVGDIACPAK